MDAIDLVLRGGRLVLPGQGLVEADLAISAGIFAGVLAPGAPLKAEAEIDIRGLVAMPAALDVHLHLGHGKDIARPRVPADADRETAAAARGGIATMIPYLMATEPFEQIFDEVRAITAAGARVDFGYHFIISTPEQRAAVPRYIADYGVATFKFFMNNRGGEGNRLGLPDIDDGAFFELFELAAKHGGMVCPHPENIEIAWVLRDRTMKVIPKAKAGLRHGTRHAPASWRPRPCSGRASWHASQGRRCTSCIPRRRKRWRPPRHSVRPVHACGSRPARTTSRTTSPGRAA